MLPYFVLTDKEKREILLSFTEKTKLKTKYSNEKVLVVPFSATKNIPDGFIPSVFSNKDIQALESNAKFIYRYDAEYNQSFQQIIPYIIVTSRDKKKIFVSERLAGEERLLKKLSFFGGHINPVDQDNAPGLVFEQNFPSVVYSGGYREIDEEVYLVNSSPLKLLGTVRELNSSTPDHLGIVFTIEADDASIRETETLSGKWLDFEETVNEYHNFEGWAKKIIDSFFKANTNDFSKAIK